MQQLYYFILQDNKRIGSNNRYVKTSMENDENSKRDKYNSYQDRRNNLESQH